MAGRPWRGVAERGLRDAKAGVEPDWTDEAFLHTWMDELRPDAIEPVLAALPRGDLIAARWAVARPFVDAPAVGRSRRRSAVSDDQIRQAVAVVREALLAIDFVPRRLGVRKSTIRAAKPADHLAEVCWLFHETFLVGLTELPRSLAPASKDVADALRSMLPDSACLYLLWPWMEKSSAWREQPGAFRGVDAALHGLLKIGVVDLAIARDGVLVWSR